MLGTVQSELTDFPVQIISITDPDNPHEVVIYVDNAPYGARTKIDWLVWHASVEGWVSDQKANDHGGVDVMFATDPKLFGDAPKSREKW